MDSCKISLTVSTSVFSWQFERDGGGVHPFKKEIYLVKKIKIKTTKEYKVNHPQITEGKAARVPRFVRVTHTRVSPTAQAYHIHSPRCAFLTEHRLL